MSLLKPPTQRQLGECNVRHSKTYVTAILRYAVNQHEKTGGGKEYVIAKHFIRFSLVLVLVVLCIKTPQGIEMKCKRPTKLKQSQKEFANSYLANLNGRNAAD